MRRRTAVLVVVASVAVGSVGAAWAASLLLTPHKLTLFSYCIVRTSTADSDVDQGSSSSNFGTSSDLYVRSKVSGNRRAFVRFDLSGCNAKTTATVTAATLELYLTGAPGSSRTYGVRRATASWTETGITWANQPAVGSLTSTTTTGTASGVWRSWSVAADVQAWFSGSAANNGLRISDESESDAASPEAKFAPREWGTSSQRPRLVVQYYP